MSQMIFDQTTGKQGVAVTIDALKNGNYINTVQTNSVSATTFAPDLSKGNVQIVNITANVALTINAPINMPINQGPGGSSVGLQWILYVQNKSGGALTTQPVLSAAYRVSGTLPSIANNQAWTVELFYDGTNQVSIGPVTTSAF